MADVQIELTRESKLSFEESLKKYDKEVEIGIKEVLKRVSLDILTDSIKNLQSHGNISSGKLAKNGRFKMGFGGLFAEIVYTGYAGAIEFGRRAGKFPPVAEIAQWVKRKGIAKGKAIKAVAFLIARSIANNGTKASPFLAPAFDKHIGGFRDKIIAVLNKANK